MLCAFSFRTGVFLRSLPRKPPRLLDILFNKFYIEVVESQAKRQFAGIRIQREVLHQARVAAVSEEKTLGQWLEEAIAEKIRREKKAGEEKRK